MIERSLTTHRVERYRIDLLDNDDNLVEAVTRADIGGRVTLNVNATIRGGGKITVTGMEDVKWTQHRIQIWASVKDVAEWPLGVFIPSVPTAEFADEDTTQAIELHDKILVLNQDKVDHVYTVPAGRVVTDEVRAIIESAGETSIAITESDATVTSPMVWDAGTTKLRIINDLLDYINYFAVWCDGYGQYRVQPYVRPAQRPTAWEFLDDEFGIYDPSWSREQDLYDVPNKFVLIGEGDGDEEGLIGVATNADPESEFSYQSRGRWITETETGVEAADQATINDLARRRLIAASSPSATMDVRHGILPLMYNDVVKFRSKTRNVTAVIEKMEYTLKPGALCNDTWREVVDL